MARNKMPSDPQGRYIRVYVSLLNSPAYRVLGFAAKALFTDMREKVNGVNNGNIEATITTLSHKGWTSPGTLSNALYELRTMGFLQVTRGGGVEVGSRVCSLYRFTDLEMYDQPKLGIARLSATHDYQRFQSVAEAEAALREGVKHLKEQAIDRKQKAAERKKTTLRNSYRSATEIVAVEGGNRYEIRSSDHSTDTEIVADKSTAKTPQTRMHQGSPAVRAGGHQ
jgi:hypothetical protein